MKQKFDIISSTCVPLPLENVDTDQIIPARFLKATTREESFFGENLFRDWRYNPDGSLNEDFVLNNPKYSGEILVAGKNFGSGSSREHAALVPLYLGVKAVITKSFARIHVANLVNAGILPFTFKNEEDYDKISQMDELSLPSIRECIKNNETVVLKNITKGEEYELDSSHLSSRQREMLLCGGLLDYTREMNK